MKAAEKYPAGYELPVHRALTERQMLAGAPSKFVILNATFAAALVMGAHAPWGIPVAFTFHLLLVSLCKKDPYFPEVLIGYLKQVSWLKE